MVIHHAQFVRKLLSVTGWRRNLTLFVLGVCATLTLPPFFLLPLIIPSFALFLLLLWAAPTRKRAFWDGWWWGMGFYTTGLYWFCIALLTDEKFIWLIPFALFFVPSFLSIYTGIATSLFTSTKTRGLSGIFVFATVWTLIEYARGHLFGGFPWNLEGYSFAHTDQTLQMASLVGAYGLTWFAVYLGAVPAALIEVGGNPKKAFTAVVLAYGLFIIGAQWGAWRINEADREPLTDRYVEDARLRLIQPNIAQQYRWDPQQQMKNVGDIVELSQQGGLSPVTHLIWPETAVPYIIRPGSGLVQMLGSSLPEGTLLITGSLRAEGEPKPMRIFNTVFAINHDGDIVGGYDKSKLVPFGEFLPFRAFLPAFVTTPVGDTDFSEGPGPITLQWGGIKVSPLVCYEAIFPELAVDPKNRPDVLLNVTNDAWFGTSTGPYQHYTMARTRAVEQGIPLVRAANTGISVVTDRLGRPIAKLALGTRGVIDQRLPKAQSGPTVYGRFHETPLQLLLIVSLVLIIRHKTQAKS